MQSKTRNAHRDGYVKPMHLPAGATGPVRILDPYFGWVGWTVKPNGQRKPFRGIPGNVCDRYGLGAARPNHGPNPWNKPKAPSADEMHKARAAGFVVTRGQLEDE